MIKGVFDLRLADIGCKKITCIIHTSTQEEADMLFKAVDSYDHNGKTWASWWDVYKEKTCYRTDLGEVVAYGCMDNYIGDGEKVIEFSDLVATGGYCNGFRGGKTPTHRSEEPKLVWFDNIKLPTATEAQERIEQVMQGFLNIGCCRTVIPKEKKKMSTKFTFYTEEGYRIDKSNNSKVETITTFIKINGFDNTYLGMATCDKVDYSEREGVINALANAMCNGNFDREFNKAVKDNARADKKARTCTYCGQLFDTVAEKEAHEVWHVERRKARHERYLLRKRAKEIAFEEQAQKMAKEIIAEDNKK